MTTDRSDKSLRGCWTSSWSGSTNVCSGWSTTWNGAWAWTWARARYDSCHWSKWSANDETRYASTTAARMARQHGSAWHGACAKVRQPRRTPGQACCNGRLPRATADAWPTWSANATGCSAEDGLAAATTTATDSDATTSTAATATRFETGHGSTTRRCDPGSTGYADAGNANATSPNGKNDVPTTRGWQSSTYVSTCG